MKVKKVAVAEVTPQGHRIRFTSLVGVTPAKKFCGFVEQVRWLGDIDTSNRKVKNTGAPREVPHNSLPLLNLYILSRETRREWLTLVWKKQSGEPVCFSGVREDTGQPLGNLWLYNGFVYEAPEELTPADVLVLIKSAELQRNKMLAKLRKLVDTAEKLGTATKREPIPEDVQLFVWQRDGGRCVKCGNNENLEYDHIIPVSKGGANTARNIQLLCESCNRSKHNRIGG